jgi:hypothetical protein
LEKTFKFFGRKTCDVCHKARGKIEYFINRWSVAAPLVYIDVDQPEGMAEGAWYDVADIPTIVLEEGDNIVGRWKEKPPRLNELIGLFGINDPRAATAEEA